MGKMDGLEVRKEVVCVKKQYYSERLVQKKSPPLSYSSVPYLQLKGGETIS